MKFFREILVRKRNFRGNCNDMGGTVEGLLIYLTWTSLVVLSFARLLIASTNVPPLVSRVRGAEGGEEVLLLVRQAFAPQMMTLLARRATLIGSY